MLDLLMEAKKLKWPVFAEKPYEQVRSICQ